MNASLPLAQRARRVRRVAPLLLGCRLAMADETVVIAPQLFVAHGDARKKTSERLTLPCDPIVFMRNPGPLPLAALAKDL